MTSQAANIPILKPEATVLPAAVLETLAARFRPGGLFLVVLRHDGSVAYHDPGAGVFFDRYVLPLLKMPDPAGQSAREKTEAQAQQAIASHPGNANGNASANG